ncbi:MAG: lipoyl synthase, partial [Byssovorax sp.]
PTPKHHDVVRFVHPDVFAAWEEAARGMGFLYAASGPLVRSSYRAAEVFVRSLLGEPGGEGETAEKVEALLGARLAEARQAAARVTAAIGAPEGLIRRDSTLDTEGALIPTASLVRR